MKAIVGTVPKTPTGEVVIHKVKIKNQGEKDEEISIAYGLPVQNAGDEKIVNFKSKQPPKESLHRAVGNLLEDVVLICGLDETAWENGVVTGITFKYNDDEGYDVVITAQCVVNDLVNVVINTPLVHPKDELETKLNNTLAEIEEYLNGKVKNQQLSIL